MSRLSDHEEVMAVIEKGSKMKTPRDMDLTHGKCLVFDWDQWHIEIDLEEVTIACGPVLLNIPRKVVDAFVHWFVGEPY